MGDGLEELVRMGLLQGEWWHTFLSRLFLYKKGVSTSLQLFFMTASMAWRPWSQCPDMWSVLFAQPAQQVGEKEALGLLQSGG